MNSKRLFWLIYPFFLIIILTMFIVFSFMAIDMPQISLFKIMVIALVLAIFAALSCVYISRKLSLPLDDMAKTVKAFGEGNLTKRLSSIGVAEIDELSDMLNRVADKIERRFDILSSLQGEQEAVMASMIEGVLAIDPDERLININSAAERMLNISSERARGRPIQEIVRNSSLQKFIEQTLTAKHPIESEIVLGNPPNERFIQVHGTVLNSSAGENLGALIVLDDITNLRRLENVRRDFVANVSHELKTPITSIKGFVETLLEGASNSPEDTLRFLEIMARQADRLNAIIEDLLSLSRIEKEAEQGEISLNIGKIKDVLTGAIQTCQLKAKENKITIELECDDNLKANINQPLLEQAVINLLDNAIKYSDAGTSVLIKAEKVSEEIVISVVDRGCGIEQEHLPRIFERFYRVDKARSRKLGGTGLGLAIVKHIIIAHRGKVIAESTPGQGSSFSIHLPLAQG